MNNNNNILTNDNIISYDSLMKGRSTLFLKTVVFLFAVAVFVLCIFLIRALLTQPVGGYFPILLGMLAAAVPFFAGARETLKILHLIDHKKAFTTLSLHSLRRITYYGVVISLLYGGGMPYIYRVAQRDDAPGVILLGLIFTFVPMIAAIFAALLQRLIQNAIDLKSENDLTV